MSRYVPVKDHPHLVRDKESNAIINTDPTLSEQVRQFKLQKEAKQKNQRDITKRMENLESDLSEIKEALNLLLNKIT